MKIGIMIFLTIYLYGVQGLVGLNDDYTMFFIVFTALLMFPQIHTMQVGSRELMRVIAKPGAPLEQILTGANLRTIIMALIVGLISSYIMVITLKGIFYSYNWWTVIVLIISTSAIIIIFNNFAGLNIKIVDDNFKQEVANHVIEISRAVKMALLISVLLSLAFSLPDTNSFFRDPVVTLENFENNALTHAIVKTDENTYGRFFVHLFLLFDGFKQSVTNIIYQSILQNFLIDWFWLYCIIVIFNILKLLPFAFAFASLQNGTTMILNYISERFNKRNIGDKV